MKTVTLRELVRETRKVKQFTQNGASVMVTDNGKPLWKVSPVVGEMDEETRQKRINELLDDVMKGPKSEMNLGQFLIDNRE